MISSSACCGWVGGRPFKPLCPRNAVLVLFKYALEKAASPASHQVWSQDGAGEGERTLVL